LKKIKIMKVKFLKDTEIYKGRKPYKAGQMAQFTADICKKHWVKGNLEILDEHDFKMPKKEEKKEAVNKEKKID